MKPSNTRRAILSWRPRGRRCGSRRRARRCCSRFPTARDRKPWDYGGKNAGERAGYAQPGIQQPGAGARASAVLRALGRELGARARHPKDLWKGGLAISGLYDLRPLPHIDFLQPDLRLDEASALRLSPAFLPPATRSPVMTCVGGDESSEFHRQNALLGERWRAAFAGDIAMPGTHHFSVVDGLANQSSALFQGACRLMKLDK